MLFTFFQSRSILRRHVSISELSKCCMPAGPSHLAAVELRRFIQCMCVLVEEAVTLQLSRTSAGRTRALIALPATVALSKQEVLVLHIHH